MNKTKLLKELFSRKRGGRRSDLSNVQKLCEFLGCSLAIPTILVTGTNGKGSTAFYINNILMAHGIKVGLFTSPHLVFYNERFKINDQQIPDDELFPKIKNLMDFCSRQNSQATFFEITTALAISYFEQQAVDIQIMEAGMGGHLDATTILSPLHSIITTIDFDHMESLGNTLEEIAHNKASIIKPNSSAWLGPITTTPLTVIKRQAVSHNVPINEFLSDYEYQVKNNHFVFKMLRGIHTQQISLKSSPHQPNYQHSNFALSLRVAISLAESNFYKFNPELLKTVLLKTWPGRFESKLLRGRRIIFDVAHNPRAILELCRHMKTLYKNPIVLLCFLQDKDCHGMLKIIEQHFSDLHFFTLNEDRAWKIEDVPSDFRKYPFHKSFSQALESLENHKKSAPILCTGSSYAIGDIYSRDIS